MVSDLLIEKLINSNSKRLNQFPNKKKARDFIEALFEFLFVSQPQLGVDKAQLEGEYKALENELDTLLLNIVKEEEERKNQVSQFSAALPFIYERLMADAEAILAADPAATSMEEVIAAYPGFFATVIYRVSHQLYHQGLKVLSRFFTEYAHSKTGIDIHPGAVIGHAFVIDHGTGVVIGETSIIGNNVKIYQGVTLGALNVSKDKASVKRHPTIQDGVVIYAGATILGGNTIVGRGSIIGGNVWLTYSVPSNSVVYHKSEVHVKDNNPFPEPLNFVI
jgi:serine O-acetyltransferase